MSKGIKMCQKLYKLSKVQYKVCCYNDSSNCVHTMKALDIHSQIQRKLLEKKLRKENTLKICWREFLIVLDVAVVQNFQDVVPAAVDGKNVCC